MGLDVHKDSIDIATANAGRDGEVRHVGSIGGDLVSLDKALRKLISKGHRLQVVYEAGPCGFVIWRHLKCVQGIDCDVVAPSSIPKRSGDRVKTDRRDTMMLARLSSSGELSAVRVPGVADEAVRDLAREPRGRRARMPQRAPPAQGAAAAQRHHLRSKSAFSHNDPKLRATPGAVGVLHTHNRRLDLHPHVHMVMPAAALDTKRKLWRTKKRRSKSQRGSAGTGGYLFNHKALAKVFRAKVLDAIERAGLTLPDKLPGTWVVDCRCVGDGSKALLYLGRYLYRGVIQEADILRCEDGNVTFGYRDAKTDRMALRTLPGADFLWLVLQHVLPKGLRRARNFGFLHPNSAGAIRLLQVLHLRAARAADATAAPPRPAWRCTCGQPMHVVRRRMPALQPDGRLDEHTAGATPIASPEVEVHDKVHDRPDKPVTQQAHPMH